MVRSFCWVPLLIVFLLGFSGQLSPASAGVIPLGSMESLSQNATSLECRNGSYRAVERLASGRESHTCMVCSKCPCGILVLWQCNTTGDTVCSEQCEDANTVFNKTLMACVSLLGGVDCSTYASSITPESADYTTTAVMTSYRSVEVHINYLSLWSPVHAFFKALSALAILGIGTTVLVLIARHRGYLKGLSTTPRCTESASCEILNTTSSKIKCALTPKHFVGQNVYTEKTVYAGSRDLHVPLEYFPMATEEHPLLKKPLDLPIAEDIQVSHNGEDPYWLVMSGWFTTRGGVLRCEDSDVFLEIPPGAIPESVERQEIVAKVALVTSRFDFKLKKDEVCLSPVVELLSPGLDGFDDMVTIHIPHRALIDPDSDWSFKVHFTRSHGNTEGGWQKVDEDRMNHSDDCSCVACHRSPSSDVTFRTNTTHFVIKTPHFSKYVCSGCGKKRYLNLEAVVSAKYLDLPNRQQVDLNCYIVDTIKDYWQRVKDNEGQRPRSERHPIHLKSKEPICVSLLTDSKTLGEEWTWRAETYGGHRPTSVAIPIRNIVRCCSDAVPYFVTFSLRPNTLYNHATPTTLFESLVSYSQKESVLELPISIAFDLRDPTKSKQHLSSLAPTPQLASDALIRNVVLEIPGNQWKDLFRRLLDSDIQVDRLIEELQHNYQDMGERKYQMLQTWRQRKGNYATVQRLNQTLRACGLVEIAERIEGGLIKDAVDVVP